MFTPFAPSSTSDPSARRPGVALIGYRGSGKSTVGRLLAEAIGVAPVDTDELIVKRTGLSIADIFVTQGEPAFRRLESEVIAGLLDDPPRVVALGGGMVERAKNIRLIRRIAKIVYLWAPPEVLYERIRADGAGAASRPPLTERQGLEEVIDVLARRDPLYQQACDWLVDSSLYSPRSLTRWILKRLHHHAGWPAPET